MSCPLLFISSTLRALKDYFSLIANVEDLRDGFASLDLAQIHFRSICIVVLSYLLLHLMLWVVRFQVTIIVVGILLGCEVVDVRDEIVAGGLRF